MIRRCYVIVSQGVAGTYMAKARKIRVRRSLKGRKLRASMGYKVIIGMVILLSIYERYGID